MVVMCVTTVSSGLIAMELGMRTVEEEDSHRVLSCQCLLPHRVTGAGFGSFLFSKYVLVPHPTDEGG